MTSVRLAPLAGSTGPVGATGATGPAGAATYILRQRTSDFSVPTSAITSDPVLQINSVPVGVYVVSGVVRLQNPNGSGTGALYTLGAVVPTGTQFGNLVTSLDATSTCFGYSGGLDGNGSLTSIPFSTAGACTISVLMTVTTAGAFALRHNLNNAIALNVRTGSWITLEKIG